MVFVVIQRQALCLTSERSNVHVIAGAPIQVASAYESRRVTRLCPMTPSFPLDAKQKEHPHDTEQKNPANDRGEHGHRAVVGKPRRNVFTE